MDVSGPFISLPVLDRVFPQGLDPHDPDRSADLRRHYEDWAEKAEDPDVLRSWVLAVLNRTLEIPSQLIVEPSALSQNLDVRVAQHHETLGPDLVIVEPPGRPNAGRARVLIQIVPRHQDLEKALEEADWKASPATRIIELIRGTGGDGVRLGLLTNGEQWMLVHAPRGETAGYATWQAELWLEEPITLRGFRSLLGVRRLFGVPEGETLGALYAASANDQQEVTDRLGLQVRRAVEILFQAIDRIDQDRNRQLLKGFDEKQLYSAAVTVMMRLVFLLYAEEQKLLPIEDPFYAQHYAASTLLEQLQEDEDRLGEQVLERRHAACNRLLATFRAVHGGIEHESLRLPAYGGGLFDPDRYPFLEGRAVDSKWREVSAQPLRISDLTVLDLLRSIQFLEVQGLSGGGAEAQHLSFKALGVEQIGHVYESLLDHTAVRAESAVIGLAGPREPEIALTELEQYRRKGHEALLDFLVDKTGKSRNAVDNALKYQIESDDNRWLVCCGNDTRLFGRVQPWAGLVREDSQGLPTVIAAGSVYATTGSDRRSTGAYYTPRSLTEPIVQYTLEPLVYQGPAEGKPEEEWVLRSAREILSLKVCDMACGSGAFLVQACRYLSERLVDAWNRVEAAHPGTVVVTPEGDLSEARPSECIIPKNAEERFAVARRLVADRCLYAVDVNPMAVEMAKLSLWLVTLERSRPFTFLDHAIKCGDSLLGIRVVDQIKNFSLDPTTSRHYIGIAEACQHALAKSQQLREELASLPVVDLRDAEKKTQLLRRADQAVAVLRVVGDVLVGEAFVTTASRALEGHPEMTEVPTLLPKVVRETVDGRDEMLMRLKSIASQGLSSRTHGIRRPFHWPLEFPEVFAAGSGFHAFIGNPPFITGTAISTRLGADYKEYLKRGWPHLEGRADICVVFMIRAAELVISRAVMGFVGSNTTSQTDSRLSGPAFLLNRGYRIIRAVKSMPWPGTAAVFICQVHFYSGAWAGACVLDGIAVGNIDSSFESTSGLTEPFALMRNKAKSFTGTKVYGNGFVLSLDEGERLLASAPKYRTVVKPYLIGRELNEDPKCRPARYIIDFTGLSAAEAQAYTKAWQIVDARVREERQSAPEVRMRNIWWQFQRPRAELYALLQKTGQAWVVAATSDTIAFVGVPYDRQRPIVFSHAVNILTLDGFAEFAAIQSSVHLVWARRYGSSLKGDFRYTTSDCFDTFPMPKATVKAERIGREYHQHRAAVMGRLNEGLTAIYGRLHDKRDSAADIRNLRDLQVTMDEAIVSDYGWSDITLAHNFVETRQGIRFMVCDDARRAILDRLLELNHARHAEEEKEEGSATVNRPKRAKRGPKDDKLFDIEA